MADFLFRGANPDGRTESGSIQAESFAEAMRQLEERRLTVYELRPNIASGVLRSKRIKHDDLVMLVRELATLATAGISLADALGTLSDANSGTPLGRPLAQMVKNIQGGEGFSAALQKTGLALPEYVHAMVRAGEATGSIGKALSRAADQMDFDAKLRAQTKEALVYPTILVGTGTVAVLFIFSFVVPRFAGLLKGRFDELPWISTVVLKLGMFFNTHFWAVVAMLVLLITALLAVFRRPTTRLRMLELASQLPMIGAWIQSGETARWTGSLAMLLDSKVAILNALSLTAGSVRLAETASKLEKVYSEVNRGKPLSQAIDHEKLLEPTSLSMVRVGEQSGELSTMLQHVAHYWSEKNHSMQRRMVALIEPASILLLGFVIGFVMVGVVLAMASLSEVKI
ncbi:type II secretion system F family protein [Chitinimonas sp. BJYL2]|uniref:type II secretion system F family protein n=1 Tax=Chitinimonas sp. BJYL2 TaxID=2976696 RepID=UPI0022B53921|nr:type II secretion system F family protein [Chitinimonas sp. BJYL2]